MGYAADEGQGSRSWQPDMDTGAYPVIDGYAGLQRLADDSGPDRLYDPQDPRTAHERRAPLAAPRRRASARRWIAEVIRRAGR